MTLAWLQLSYRQTKAYSFFDRNCGCVHYHKISRLVARPCLLPPKSPIPVTKGSHFLPGSEHCLLFGDREQGFCACAALESLLWFVTFWPKCKRDRLNAIVSQVWSQLISCQMFTAAKRILLSQHGVSSKTGQNVTSRQRTT